MLLRWNMRLPPRALDELTCSARCREYAQVTQKLPGGVRVIAQLQGVPSHVVEQGLLRQPVLWLTAIRCVADDGLCHGD